MTRTRFNRGWNCPWATSAKVSQRSLEYPRHEHDERRDLSTYYNMYSFTPPSSSTPLVVMQSIRSSPISPRSHRSFVRLLIPSSTPFPHYIFPRITYRCASFVNVRSVCHLRDCNNASMRCGSIQTKGSVHNFKLRRLLKRSNWLQQHYVYNTHISHLPLVLSLLK